MVSQSQNGAYAKPPHHASLLTNQTDDTKNNPPPSCDFATMITRNFAYLDEFMRECCLQEKIVGDIEQAKLAMTTICQQARQHDYQDLTNLGIAFLKAMLDITQPGTDHLGNMLQAYIRIKTHLGTDCLFNRASQKIPAMPAESPVAQRVTHAVLIEKDNALFDQLFEDAQENNMHLILFENPYKALEYIEENLPDYIFLSPDVTEAGQKKIADVVICLQAIRMIKIIRFVANEEEAQAYNDDVFISSCHYNAENPLQTILTQHPAI